MPHQNRIVLILSTLLFLVASDHSHAQDTGLRIDKNSVLGGLDGAQILLFENENDYARFRITNSLFNSSTNNRFWDIAGKIGPDNTGLEDRLNFYLNGVGDILSLRGTGRVGVRTTSPEATLHVNGYTKLGEGAPNIKMKELTATSSSSETGQIEVLHGISDPSTIIDVQMMMHLGNNSYIPPNTAGSGPPLNQFLYIYVIADTEILIINQSYDTFGLPPQESPIQSRPLKIIITYKE